MSDTLRLAFVIGTEPGKWFERYRASPGCGILQTSDSEDSLACVISGDADLALARIPGTGKDARIDENFHVVRLYEEAPGIAVPKDSVFAELGHAVDMEDVEGEIVNYQIGADEMVDVAAVRDALQIVAANVGIALAPKPLLKVLSKKLVVPLTLNERPGQPRTAIALVWRKDKDSEEIQSFVGICRGRRPSSSRGEGRKLSAVEKAEARKARREKAGKSASQRSREQTLSKRKRAAKRGKRR